MYTDLEVYNKYLKAAQLHLSGAELLCHTENVKKYANGIGADWMPKFTRKIISEINPTLVLAADIHDLRYAQGGDELDREFADNEMLQNGLKLADDRYMWFDPRRYICRLQMRKFHTILREFGGLAWKKGE
ncbi:MAG: hypothetical protein LBM70_03865 [Victivallales bacterium]|jgi:hypothetical protein|nr:hypothetical protein [Victivallales bacterium]